MNKDNILRITFSIILSIFFLQFQYSLILFDLNEINNIFYIIFTLLIFLINLIFSKILFKLNYKNGTSIFIFLSILFSVLIIIQYFYFLGLVINFTLILIFSCLIFFSIYKDYKKAIYIEFKFVLLFGGVFILVNIISLLLFLFFIENII